MADESHVIRGINWRETFPFTQIFRAFRVAIHPSKLILALLALLALYAGGRILDAIWPVQSRAIPAVVGEKGEVVVPAEVYEFEGFRPGAAVSDFQAARKAHRKEIEDHYAGLLGALDIEKDSAKAHTAATNADHLSKVKDKLIEQRNKDVAEAQKAKEAAEKAARDYFDKEGKNASGDKLKEEQRRRDDALTAAENAYRTSVRESYRRASALYDMASSIKGQGLFIQFFEYEYTQVNNVAWAVLANDWLGGFGGNRTVGGRTGVFASIKNFFVTGPWWLASQHTTFFILFVIVFSLVWAIFGGAICRIAAVHVARDEKISLSAALRFSTGKFLSFMFAPIIPLVIVLVVGLIVALGGLLGNIPFLGPILVGLFFFLALAAGFVMTLVLLGTAGGFNLMYPTIAVEGSDSFDAISRSFSYVYARPWRMLFYTLVALLYGALCFLFVRFFLSIMLMLTHHFVGAGMFSNVDSNVPIDAWNTMWPPPSGGFTYDIDTLSLSGGQAIGAFLVAIWVYLTIGMLGAFAISFYFSANTIIYYLMRREVDATELDDVYLEQSDEDFGGDAAGAAAPAVTATTTTTTVTTTTAPATGGAAPGDTPPPASPPPAT
jgi:hypothetical protein